MSYTEYKMLLCNCFEYYTMTWEIREAVCWGSYEMGEKRNKTTPQLVSVGNVFHWNWIRKGLFLVRGHRHKIHMWTGSAEADSASLIDFEAKVWLHVGFKGGSSPNSKASEKSVILWRGEDSPVLGTCVSHIMPLVITFWLSLQTRYSKISCH